MNNILNFTEEKLKTELSGFDIAPYRSTQIFRWLHKHLVINFDEMNNIPVDIKKTLSENYSIKYPEISNTVTSGITQTSKYLFDNKFESVDMKEKSRRTFCISTQAGCNAGCIFCATGYMGFKANLSAGEIVSQVYSILKEEPGMPTNIVFMGMGEPFLNYGNLLSSLKILTSENGLEIPAKKITVSTIGIKGKIKTFADELLLEENKKIKNIKLALSLHSTNEGLRQQLLPQSKNYPLSEVLKDVVYFYRKTKSKITYEYIYFEGINDTEDDIKRIKKLCGMVPCNFNIIAFHPVEEIFNSLRKPENKFEEKLYNKLKEPNYSLSNKNLNYFIERLRSEAVITNLRASNGLDISAACGQLALKKI